MTSHEFLLPSATSHEVIGNAVCLAHVDDIHFDKIPIKTEPNVRAMNEMINQLLLDANTIFVSVQDGLRTLFRHTVTEIGIEVLFDGLPWDASGNRSCGDGQRLRLLLTNGGSPQVLRLFFFGNLLGLL